MESSTASHSSSTRPPVRRRPSPNVILAVLMVGTFLAPLDSSIVNIALPDIATRLQTSVTAVSWVADAYLLASATLLLSMGRLGDVWGLRRLYVWGLLVFGAGSLACALSSSLAWLVASRVLQSVGAAMLFAAGPAIVARTFPPEKRGWAFGIITLAVAAGLTAGPALGGVLVGSFGWPSIFLINVPLSVIAAAAGWFTLSDEESLGEAFDMWGAVLAGGALLSLLGALTEAGNPAATSLEVAGALAASAVLGVSFIWWEMKAPTPMVDVRLFRSPVFSAGLAAALLAYMAMFSVIFTMPFYLVRAHNIAETPAGLMLTSLPFAMAALAPYAGRVSDRIGSKLLSTVGMAIIGLGLLWLSFLERDSSPAFIMAGLFVVGAGMAVFQTPNTAAVLSATPRARAGVGSALIAEARNVGMAVGIAFTAAVVGGVMGKLSPELTAGGAMPGSASSALISGMALAMRVSVVLAVIAAALSWLFGDEARQ
jgi:EmrB/QacA subfamily drug resistance transporter